MTKQEARKDLALGYALGALKRIERKRGGFLHLRNRPEACDCPKCIAQRAIEEIKALAGEDLPPSVQADLRT